MLSGLKKRHEVLIFIFVAILLIGGCVWSVGTAHKEKQDYGSTFLENSKEYNTADSVFGEVTNVELDLLTDEYEIEVKVLDKAKKENGYYTYSYTSETFNLDETVVGNKFTLETGIKVVITTSKKKFIVTETYFGAVPNIVTYVKDIKKIKEAD